MIVLIARYVCHAGMGDRVEAALREMIPLNRGEPGCRDYRVHRSVDHPDEFLL